MDVLKLIEEIARAFFFVVASFGSCAWILKWWTNRILNKYISATWEFENEDIESLFRRVSGFLKLDMTYLLSPTDVDDYVRSHSFNGRGYFKRIRDTQEKVYKFIFYEKNNSDKNVTTRVDTNKKELLLELNLPRKDLNKIRKLLLNDNYSLKKLNKWCHKKELKDLIQNL